jgi:hypothetical protein
LLLPWRRRASRWSRPWTHSAELGAIGFNLTLPDDMQSEDLDYKIVGTGAFQKLGKVAFGVHSHSFSATITHIPVAAGYQLQLTAGSRYKLGPQVFRAQRI